MTRDFARRLVAATRHPEYARAQTLVPEESLAGAIVVMVLAGCSIGFAATIVILAPQLPAVWLVAIVVAIGMGIVVRGQWLELYLQRGAPVQRTLAAILGKGDDGMATRLLWNAVLIWSPKGGLQRFEARGRVHRACMPGDIGVALYRGRHLVGWVKVPT